MRDTYRPNLPRMALLASVLLFAGMSAVSASPAAAAPIPTDPNLRVAFIGDQGVNTGAKDVLNLIKNENVGLVIHNGDLGYGASPADWESQLNGILGANFPYVWSVGNHDTELGRWPDYQQRLKDRVARVPGMSCTGDLGVNSWCTYRGLWFLLSGAGTLGSGHDTYIRDNCNAANNTWKVVGWHKNQNAMQVGGKPDETGWPVYEETRKCGALITTAHEHSYARTRTLTNTQTQTVDSTCGDANAVCVDPGRSFVFHSGLGGASIRDQERCLPATFPYGCKQEWASIYTTNQGAKFGALFIDFNVDGDPNKARGYFKNTAGQVIDSFTITTGPPAPPPPHPQITADSVPAGDITIDGGLSEAAWKHDGTDLPYGLSKVVSGTWNNTAKYSTLWNNTYLYVGVRVTDATLNNDSVNAWDDDSVEVYVDGNHNHATFYDASDNQYIKGYNDTALFAKNGNTSGVLHAWKAVTGGYEIELAIPWANLGVTSATDKIVGFDVGNNDDDNGGARDGQAVAFGTANNWTDTSAFADLKLTGAAPPDITAKQVTAGTITVDGSLSETVWNHGGTNLPYGLSKVVSGTWNNTAKYSVLWNSTYLYVGVRVTDATLNNDSVNVWDDDSVEVYVDGNHNHGASYDASDNQYIKGYNDTALFAKNGNTSGVLHAWKAVTGGYEIELAIPWSNLGVSATGGMTVGFDVGNNDDDNGAARDGQAVAFGTANNWTDTSAFADLQLTTG